MDKRYSQLELFTGGQEREPGRDEPRHGLFTFHVNGYEKTVFLLIGFIVTGVLFYCLGVEHGKARAMARMNVGFDLAAKPVPAQRTEARVSAVAPVKSNQASQSLITVAVPLKQGQVKNGKPAAVVAEERTVRAGGAGKTASQERVSMTGFTIQIGTYQVEAAAERERDNLAKFGLSPVILKQGRYNVVIVGNFSDKEMARSLLSRLRQNYRDCYIRRL